VLSWAIRTGMMAAGKDRQYWEDEMNKIKQWFLNRIGISDLCVFFYNKGIRLDLKFEKQQPPERYAKDSRIYKRKGK